YTQDFTVPGGEEASEAGLRAERGLQKSEGSDLSGEEASRPAPQ
ncbi:STK11 isoform 2, partial [Pan troglodytes]